MRVVNNCLLLTVVLALLLCSGCGGRKSPGIQSQLRNQAGERPVSAAASDFTAEDYKVMAMPYEERLAYLEDKLKQLVYELHGIVIEETVLGSKSASSAGVPATSREKHGVQKPLEYLNECLSFEWRDTHREWNLRFYERLNGDLDLNSMVAIADITPIAMNYGAFYDPEGDPPGWDTETYPTAPYVDRVTSANLEIGIEDITPIAMYYGLELEGYNVYRQRGEGDERLIADWRDYDVPPPPERGRRGRRK